jgi:ribosomal protein L16 Arg81 hydroxylase
MSNQMSVGSNLQEMENVVTKNAAPGDPMPKLTTGGTPPTYEDLGGPTPENSKPDDDSNKLKTPGASLKQVRDVVNKGAKPAETAKGMKEEEAEVEVEEDQEIVSEEETTEEEVVSEEETTEEEVVAETTEESEEVVTEEEQVIDVEEDINALISGEELSEEFQEKARTIFETAIRTKVAEIKEEMKSEYEQALVEEIAAVKAELSERTDSYLEYVADEWMSENQLAVEHGLKTEMTESFLTGMRSLFEDHYVTIPEEKYDVIHSMVEKLDEMEDKLNEQINKNVALNKRLSESVADVILAEVSEGLALSQKEKLASLAENVEFESESNYREKLETLRDSYFSANSSAQRNHSENISEGTQVGNQPEVSGLMESYLQTLNRVSKK